MGLLAIGIRHMPMFMFLSVPWENICPPGPPLFDAGDVSHVFIEIDRCVYIYISLLYRDIYIYVEIDR